MATFPMTRESRKAAQQASMHLLKPAMPEEERRQKAAKLFDDVEELMATLYARWLDEQEYEAITEYAVALKSKVEAIGGTFERITSRPFGFIYKLGGATYRVSVNATGYQYKRIK